jgi:hypothetical protein
MMEIRAISSAGCPFIARRDVKETKRDALFEKQPLEQIRGADDAAMAEREAEMGDARVEVVSEALHHRRQLRSYVCTKSSRSTVASGEHAAS